MFIKTKKDTLVELEGSVKLINEIQGCTLTIYNKTGCWVLGTYETKEDANNVFTALCVAVEKGSNLFVMPSEFTFDKEALKAKIKILSRG